MPRVTNINGTEEELPEPMFVTRDSPNIVSGPYHEGILLDAANSTRELEFSFEHALENNHRVEQLLTPPEITNPDAPYEQRLLVMWRTLRMIEHEWRSDAMHIRGWLSDPWSPYIVEYEGTPFVNIQYRMGEGWELNVNAMLPNNTLAVNDGQLMPNDLLEIVGKHEKGEDVFGQNGLEFLLLAYSGWKIPILGIRKLILLDTSYEEVRTLRILTQGGTKTQEYRGPCPRVGKKSFFQLGNNGEFIGTQPPPNLRLV